MQANDTRVTKFTQKLPFYKLLLHLDLGAYNADYTLINTKSRQAYNVAYRAMNNAKLHAYYQLLTSPPKSDKTLNNVADDDNQEEQEKKIRRKREAE